MAATRRLSKVRIHVVFFFRNTSRQSPNRRLNNRRSYKLPESNEAYLARIRPENEKG